jgi:SAM-dependent methyltransferase
MSRGPTQYGTDANLARRMAIYRYCTNPVSWSWWFFANVSLPPGSVVLDVGCGNGKLWSSFGNDALEAIELHLVDTSPGMLDAARQALSGRAPRCRYHVASVEDLPFQPDSFDVAIANHMLYHAKDLCRGVSEIARVLKPAGTLYASTNGIDHMRELGDWMRQARLPTWRSMRGIVERFGLENGADALRQRFGAVTLHRYEGRLEVPAAEPVLDYAASLFNDQVSPTGEGMEELARILARELDSRGILTIHLDSGFFECGQPQKPKRPCAADPLGER